jgi:hypothetical protein
MDDGEGCQQRLQRENGKEDCKNGNGLLGKFCCLKGRT